MTRVTKRRSGPTSAAWLSSRRSSWTRPPRYVGPPPRQAGGRAAGDPRRCLLLGRAPTVPVSLPPVPAGSGCLDEPLGPSSVRRVGLRVGFKGPRRGPWDGGSRPRPGLSNFFVFFPNLEARVFATFWLDHPTAEGGAADPEAEEAAADAEGEEPVAPDGSEQAADALAETGTVHALQPRRHEQQPQLRGEEEVPDHLQPDSRQCREEERYDLAQASQGLGLAGGPTLQRSGGCGVLGGCPTPALLVESENPGVLGLSRLPLPPRRQPLGSHTPAPVSVRHAASPSQTQMAPIKAHLLMSRPGWN